MGLPSWELTLDPRSGALPSDGNPAPLTEASEDDFADLPELEAIMPIIQTVQRAYSPTYVANNVHRLIKVSQLTSLQVLGL